MRLILELAVLVWALPAGIACLITLPAVVSKRYREELRAHVFGVPAPLKD